MISEELYISERDLQASGFVVREARKRSPPYILRIIIIR
jgi:hypothetical protein